MDKKINHLTYVRDICGGSWVNALVVMFLLVICGHATAHFLFDVKWFDPMALFGSFLVGGGIAVLGRYLNRKYPNTKS